MRELSIQHILNRVDELPELPQIAFKAIQLLNDPDTDVGKLANVISSDQALTAKLLRLCNSAFYGLSRKVTTISEAVLIVGFSSIKSLILIISTQNSLNKGLLGYKISPGDFWRHSLATAEISKYLAEMIHFPEPEECFIAGLLHDIGKMVLNQFALPEVYKATNLCAKTQIPLHVAEKQTIGFDHTMVGGGLAEMWNFPHVLVNAIRQHHTVLLEHDPKAPLLSMIVALANVLVQMLEKDPLAYTYFREHADYIEEVLGLSESDLPVLLPKLEKKVDEACQMAMLIT